MAEESWKLCCFTKDSFEAPETCILAHRQERLAPCKALWASAAGRSCPASTGLPPDHPSCRLSYQRHARRSEHWFIVHGTALVTLDGEQREVSSGDAVDIPVGTDHRIENATDAPVVFVEVQHGEYFGEDDIVRLEDDYGRSDT